ncbi:MAG: hypothetical protein M2R45_02768 [Verrucomicrobia subdivision 3 bacterium]|nr:hypothetical protein [Limisphaerales bacterium]MCS1414317.1 hypothetical protein [Limisphaerales bacterium]
MLSCRALEWVRVSRPLRWFPGRAFLSLASTRHSGKIERAGLLWCSSRRASPTHRIRKTFSAGLGKQTASAILLAFGKSMTIGTVTACPLLAASLNANRFFWKLNVSAPQTSVKYAKYIGMMTDGT